MANLSVLLYDEFYGVEGDASLFRDFSSCSMEANVELFSLYSPDSE